VLGGVEINYEFGLLGHSDGDVLLHAICDAILGASSQGDIGSHFPPTEAAYKDISSLILLKRVAEMALERGFRIENIDATVVCENPRLAPYINEMKQKIAECVGIDSERVSVKAKTTEGLGFEGEGRGIAAFAVALLTETKGEKYES
ncbi:MAG: 2-C-methyl-D-erythritol 2,4-cyclodiphosphate synthase, partial [bacterium]